MGQFLSLDLGIHSISPWKENSPSELCADGLLQLLLAGLSALEQEDQHQRCAADGKDDAGNEDHIAGLGVGDIQRDLLGCEFPIQLADGLLGIVAQGDRHVQGHVQGSGAAGVEGAEQGPVGKLGGFIGGSLEEDAAALLNGKLQLLQKFLVARMGALGAHVDLNLIEAGSPVLDGDLLGTHIAGHDVLEVGEQVGIGVGAAGSEGEALALAVIGNGGIGGSRSGDGQAENQHQAEKEGK